MFDIHILKNFGVVEDLAVNLPPGTLFIDRYVQGIFSTERKFVRLLLQPVELLMPSSKTHNAVLFADEESATSLADEPCQQRNDFQTRNFESMIKSISVGDSLSLRPTYHRLEYLPRYPRVLASSNITS